MEAQKIFNTVVNHLFTQRVRAVDAEGNCVHRTETGRSCAVGCLITDEEYDSAMDTSRQTNVEWLFKIGLLPERLVPHIKLLSDLQSVHDDTSYLIPESDEFDLPHLGVALAEVAHKYGLNYQPR